jgi:hypothetical protein
VSEVTAYPLCWPNGWRRTPSHKRTRAKFIGKKGSYSEGSGWRSAQPLSIEQAITRVLDELERMGIRRSSIIISSDLRLRNDGLPYSSQATSKIDQGVSVYWQDGQQRRCMAIDRYDRIADNLGAIAATIEAMRAIERHGGAEILDRAFTGFAALPAPKVEDQPHQVLGVDEHASEAEIEYAYKRLAQQCHPDKGGSVDQMSKVNAARDAMLASRKPR